MSPRRYLDHAATTPMRPEARAAVTAAMADWANPSSPHAEGRRARAALEGARARIAAALGWPGEVILTGGATEAIGLAVTQARVAGMTAGPYEHDAVGRALKLLPDASHPAFGRTLHIQQTVNSETGMIQPPPDRAPGDLWLADCAQSAGKLPLPDADLVVVSGHKLGGPPGVGALLVRDLATLTPVGGQEQGYRPGTENLPGALGLAATLEAPPDWLDESAALRVWLDEAIRAAGGGIVAGDRPRLPTVAAYVMPGVPATAQLMQFDLAGFAVSAGSACSSGSLKPSATLAALAGDAATQAVRVSFGWTTTRVEVEAFAAEWARIAGARRAA